MMFRKITKLVHAESTNSAKAVQHTNEDNLPVKLESSFLCGTPVCPSTLARLWMFATGEPGNNTQCNELCIKMNLPSV